MYQTVGFSAVEMYSECFQIPMYREYITGKAINQKLEYVPDHLSNFDETEDLFRLISRVLVAHPDIQAVSVGAILSTYQRTRVENVCARLGLTCLAYLWQRTDQTALLDEMIAAGIDARLIKVAGIGLTKSHLGKSISEVRNDLVRLNGLYGLHVCGEGGEYETLVLDCPIFKKKLVIDDMSVVDHSMGDVAYLHLDVHLEDKVMESQWVERVEIPALYNDEFLSVVEELSAYAPARMPLDYITDEPEVLPVKIGRAKGLLKISNITNVSNIDKDIKEETTSVFNKLENILLNEIDAGDLSMVSSVSLLLKSMTDFSAVNSVYKSFFINQPIPPSRMCISTCLPRGCNLQLSVSVSIADAHPFAVRKGLYVQGRSYWAPSNIGPYSQAVSDRECIYLAGQISLIPATMELPNREDYAAQTSLSFQNLARVLSVMSAPDDGSATKNLVGKSFFAVAFVDSVEYQQAACLLWKEKPVPWKCDMLTVQVNGLPVNSGIEWFAVGVNEKFVPSEDEEIDDENELYMTTYGKDFC